MILYGNWRSLAAYRVRVALALKNVPHEVKAINMQGNEHRGEAFRKINPQGVLPALDDGHGHVLFQSLAILEYLEEAYPERPLLPKDLVARARVRGLALIVAADAHPLLVPRVREFLQQESGLHDGELKSWLDRALLTALDAIEADLQASPNTGQYCHGDTPTIADICLASHLIAAQFFKCDTSRYAEAHRIFANCNELPAFADSHPLKQAGAPE
jgi:maleylacetoacetate isomerase